MKRPRPTLVRPTFVRVAATVVAAALTFTVGRQELASSQDAITTYPNIESTLPVREARFVRGFSFQDGASLGVRLEGTSRLPKASGEAKVERHDGMTEIEIELDEMKPAAEFGGDFSTYVLWTVSPEGQVENVGEFVLDGNRSKLNVSTRLQTFGLLVTAEPHYLVRTPSTFVVLEDRGLTENGVSAFTIRAGTLEYRGYQGVYNYYRDSLEDVDEAEGEVRSEVKQARVAVDLAVRAGAREFANDSLGAAEARLEALFDAVERGAGTNTAITLAHDTIRLALDAQVDAEDRAFQAALDAERSLFADEIDARDNAIARARDEAERAALEAERAERELEMERRAREAALSEASTAALRAARAEAAVAQVRRSEQAALDRMNRALGLVAETRETARGLIVNIPDILFEFDMATLRPEAREVLGKMCGILLVAPESTLRIEGHTDSVGDEAYNDRLSNERAQSVYSYLNECGLSAGNLQWDGFGESQPIAPNDTARGRERNRRVEIVIAGEGD